MTNRQDEELKLRLINKILACKVRDWEYTPLGYIGVFDNYIMCIKFKVFRGFNITIASADITNNNRVTLYYDNYYKKRIWNLIHGQIENRIENEALEAQEKESVFKEELLKDITRQV